MTNEELIIHQAKKIIELQSNMDYWMQRFFEEKDKKASDTEPELLRGINNES